MTTCARHGYVDTRQGVPAGTGAAGVMFVGMQPPEAGDRRLQPHQVRVEKPWGWEIVWAETPQYCGKLLHIRAGSRLSLQYHDQKLETQCLLHGRALLVVEDAAGALREVEMEPGKGYTIQPFQRHRLVGIDDADIIEVSTPERGTTFRLEDDYTRPDETEELRRRPNRA